MLRRVVVCLSLLASTTVVSTLLSATAGAAAPSDAPPSGSLTTPTVVTLPMNDVGDLVADTANGHVFVGGTALVMANADGSGQPTVLSGVTDAQSLAKSADGQWLIVAEPTGVGRIPLSSPTASPPTIVSVTSLGCPVIGNGVHIGQVVAGPGAIAYFSYTCDDVHYQLGAVDLSTGQVAGDLFAGRNWFVGSVSLATSATAPSTVIATEQGNQSESVETDLWLLRMDADLTTPATVAAKTPVYGAYSLAVSSDGSHLIVGVGPLGESFQWDGSTLTAGAAPPPANPAVFDDQAWAYDAGGHYLAVIGTGYLSTFGPDGDAPVRSFTDNGYVRSRSMSFDGDTVFAADGCSGCTAHLVIAQRATFPSSTVTAQLAQTTVPGQPATLSGTLASHGATISGAQLTITRTDPDASTHVFSTTTGDDGSYSFSDTPPANGVYDYQVEYGGDTAHDAVMTTAETTVRPATSTISLSAPARATRAHPLIIRGAFAGHQAGSSGITLSVTKRDEAGTHRLASVITGTDGTFVVHDTPAVGGKNVYTVSYGGDTTHATASRVSSVLVSLNRAGLKISFDKPLYAYGQHANVKVHLGSGWRNRRVTLYAQRIGGTRHVVASRSVNAHGDLVVHVTVHYNMIYTATYAGDYHTAKAVVTASRHTKAAMPYAMRGYYRKDGAYRIFHESAGEIFIAGVAPSAANTCIAFQAQVLTGGAWHNVGRDSCEYLDQHSVAGVIFEGRAGYTFRMRAEWSGDRYAVGNHSDWGYFRVTA